MLRSTIAKQLRIRSVQDQSRSLLISTYKRLLQENADTSEIASLMDNEEAIKLTPAEKQIVNVIARDNKIDIPLTDQQKERSTSWPRPFPRNATRPPSLPGNWNWRAARRRQKPARNDKCGSPPRNDRKTFMEG